MHPQYPRSFFKLLAIGFAVAVLPLVLVLVGHALSIRKLSEQGRDAVQHAARITQASRELVETLTSLERAARQYVVLGDPALRDSIAARDHESRELIAQIAGLPLTPAQRQQLDALATEEEQIVAVLLAAAGDKRGVAAPTIPETLERFAPLADAARRMVEHNGQVVELAADALQRNADDIARLIYVQIMVLLPLTLIVVAGFTFLITRPIREIERGITGLGEGRRAEPISVSGPADLEQLGRRLDWLRLRLIELESQKNRFLRHASHELKTPLTALREGSELLAEEVSGPLTAEQQEIVRILRDNSLRLSERIGELLRYAASDFERAELRLQACRLNEIVAAVARDQALAMAAKRLRLDTRGDSVTLMADPERVRVVVDNLISNAVKFSPEDATISIDVHADGERASIEVADEGPGVAAEDGERIFEPFYRGRIHEPTGTVAGSGLGLSIARDHVLAHGGRIELLPGPGCRIRFTLPLRKAE